MCRYPSDLTDAEWVLIAAFFGRPNLRGHPGKYEKREVVNAIFYVVKGVFRGGCCRLIFRPVIPSMARKKVLPLHIG